MDSITIDKKIVLRHTSKATSGRPLTVDDSGELIGEPLTVTVEETYYKSYLELAYCTTTDTSQGAEGDRSITIVESDAMARSRITTAATRGKQAPLYVVPVDPALLPPQIENAAVETLKLILQRDDISKTAHETVERKVTEASIKEAFSKIGETVNSSSRKPRFDPRPQGPRGPGDGGPAGP